MRKCVLAALFVLMAGAAVCAVPTGYPPDVQAKLYASCYDPDVIGKQPAFPETRIFAYRWQEPRVGWQTFVNQISRMDRYTLANSGEIKYKYAPKTLGQWLTLTNQRLTLNPWRNASLLGSYWKSATDKAAYRASLVQQYGAGWDMSDPAVVSAVNKRADETMALAFGTGSGVLWDENGILVPNAYGYATNQPDLPSWWVKPAGCASQQIIPTPIQTPFVNPTPVPTSPAGKLMCIDQNTGLCREYPTIFGGSCSAFNTVPCGTPPTPTPPIVTPTPIPPSPGKAVACLSADGRYVRLTQGICDADEVELARRLP